MSLFTSRSSMTFIFRTLGVLSFCLNASSANAWLVSKDFDKGTLGQPAIGEDGFTEAANASEYTNEIPSAGVAAAKLFATKGKVGWGDWGGIVKFRTDLYDGDEVWISLRIFVPSTFDFTTDTGFLKFIRVQQMHKNGSPAGYLDNVIIASPDPNAPAFGLIKEGPVQEWFKYGSPNDRLPRGKWATFELNVKFDDKPVDQGGSGYVRSWLDGKLLTNVTGIKTLTESTDVAKSLYLFTYWNGGAPKSQHLYVDNIVITNERPPNRDSHGNAMIGNWKIVRPNPPPVF